MLMMKTLLGIGLFAAGGAAIGYSQILCFNGQCAITGTPYGGALFGGVLGLAIMSGFNTPATKLSEPPENPDAQKDNDNQAL